jgi:hypothetical protein
MLPLALFIAAGCAAGAGHGAAQSAGAASRSPAAATSRWQLVSYHGVHVTVPVAWPVVDGMHTLFCGLPFPSTPTAFIGPNENSLPSCPSIPRAPVGRDGVWLQPGIPPQNARPVTVAPGTVMLEQRHYRHDHVEQVWYHRVLIEIGIGSEPRIASAVVSSTGYTPGEPNTHAAGACARSAQSGRMPAPRRLGRRLALEQGDVTLKPPRHSDRPLMRAAQAWRESGPKSPFARYHLLLTRYSAKFPARENSDGSETPENRNVLAWVIYVRPRTAIAGCGGWSLDAFDARTGHGIDSTIWSPGP